MSVNMQKKVSFVILFLVYCLMFGAFAQDLTVKFMLDSSGAMKAQDIVLFSSSIIAAEISDFSRNSTSLYKGASIRILVDSFWQNGSNFQTQGVFDYRIGQSGIPNYEGLRNLKTKWFVDEESDLSKLVNRNWPAENKNTVLVVLTNSRNTLEGR